MTLSPRGQAWLAHQRGESYTPPKQTPEEIREDWNRAIWNAQRAIFGDKKALAQANSNEEREIATKGIQFWERVLETAKRALEEMDKP